MGDRPAERAGLGPLGVDVDPLVVAGGVGEQVHPLLGDLDPVAVAEVLAHERAQLLDAVDGPHGHQRSPSSMRASERQRVSGQQRPAWPGNAVVVMDADSIGRRRPGPVRGLFPSSAPHTGTAMKCGFVTLVGRPNVGKSSLVNAICGAKVSIVSDKPQTTRHRVRGIYNRPDAQLVFVDTPGLHKPVSALGRRVNATAVDSMADVEAGVDVVCLVLDATAPYGSGDRWVADHLDLPNAIVIVNKVDRASRDQVMVQLAAAGELRAAEYFPVSARSGAGLDALVDHLVARAPEGPAMFPPDAVRDVPEEQWVAELVREQLLAITREELPYSIATRVTEWEDRRITVEIVVERESQKGMVIGKGGVNLRQVGEQARLQLPPGTYLELRVKVDKDWQRRPDRVERLGY